jgi:hypothetical protein
MISLKPIEQAVRYQIGWEFPGWREEKGLTGRYSRIREGRTGRDTARLATCGHAKPLPSE